MLCVGNNLCTVKLREMSKESIVYLRYLKTILWLLKILHVHYLI